jgi:hypothetical protein
MTARLLAALILAAVEEPRARVNEASAATGFSVDGATFDFGRVLAVAPSHIRRWCLPPRLGHPEILISVSSMTQR